MAFWAFRVVQNAECRDRQPLHQLVFVLPAFDVVLFHQAQAVDFLLLLGDDTLQRFTVSSARKPLTSVGGGSAASDLDA